MIAACGRLLELDCLIFLVNPKMTVREFLRAIAGLGGHLGRKGDGEPGWITIWRGFEKLMLIARGADSVARKCG